MRKSHLVAIATLALTACDQAPVTSGANIIQEVTREDLVGLTQEYADFRANQVGNVRYDLTVQLDPSQDSFTGENRLSFDKSGNSGILQT